MYVILLIVSTYVFVLRIEGVPHGGDDFRHIAETGARVLSLDSRLGIPEEEGVRRHRPETRITTVKFNICRLPLHAVFVTDRCKNS